MSLRVCLRALNVCVPSKRRGDFRFDGSSGGWGAVESKDEVSTEERALRTRLQTTAESPFPVRSQVYPSFGGLDRLCVGKSLPSSRVLCYTG